MTQNNPIVQGLFDPATATISYVVHEAEISKAAIIDPVLDYDPRTARTSTRSAKVLLDYVRRHELQVDWILETHAHADHLSAAQELRRELGAGVAIGERICDVQAHFVRLFEIETEVTTDGRQFDRLFRDGDTFPIGTLQGRVMYTPGHTPACVTYVIGDAAFVGDTLFMPDYGTARTDFPGGDARSLYRSIQRILQLPPATRLFMCHDYQPGGRKPRWQTTVRDQRRDNLMVKDGISEDEFVHMRTARDATLQAPALILPSLQVNIRGGRLPPCGERSPLPEAAAQSARPKRGTVSTHRGMRGFVAAVTAGLLVTPWTTPASEMGDALRAALGHPSVDARAQESQAAQQELSAANRRYLGSGGLNAEAARYEDLRFIGVLSPTTLAAPPFDRNASRYGIAYSVPIDLFGAIGAARQAARSNLEAAQLVERQQLLIKLHDATSAYVQLQALRRQEAALTSQRQRVTATVERVRREVQVQLAAGVDLKLAESEMARITSDEVRLRGSMDEARAALEEATGQAVSVADLPMRIPPWPSATTVERALPLLLAQAQATASHAQAKEAHRSLLPSVAAVGDYSQFSVEGAPDAWSIGARFTVPLDPAAYRRASAADARARAAARREAATAGELTRQWAQLKAAYESAVADIAAVDQEVIARREVVNVQGELQRVGITSMEDFLGQQRDLVESESRQAAGRARAVIAWSAAQVLLGTDSESYIAQVE